MTRGANRGPAPPTRAGLRGLTAVLLLSAAACGGDGAEEPAPGGEASPDGTRETLPSARYLTLVAWAGSDGRPAGVLWLENRTDGADGLRRRYRGWTVEGDSVRPVLSVDDRLAARAASWRPLPAPGLGLSVDTRGQITEVDLGGGKLRLRAEREVGSWQGARGQRQRLVAGRLRTEGDTAAAAVTVAVLRFEHLAGEPGRVGPSRALLLAGADGGGLLALDEGSTRPWSRGWSWGAGGGARRLGRDALPDSAAADGSWRFAVPGEDLGGGREWVAAADSTAPSAADTAAATGVGSPAGAVVVPARATVGRGPASSAARGFLLRAAGPGS